MNTFQWRQPSYCLLYIVVSWYFHRQWNFQSTVSSVLWRCWLGGRKGIRPVKNRVVGCDVICLERGADLHTAQLMPLPLTVSCCSKIQIGFAFLVPAHPGSPGKRAVKRVCVCVCVCMHCLQCFDAVGWAAGKCIRPVKTEWWGSGVVICLEWGADLHTAQLMPLPLTISCFSKIQIGLTFLVPAHPGSPGKKGR